MLHRSANSSIRRTLDGHAWMTRFNSCAGGACSEPCPMTHMLQARVGPTVTTAQVLLQAPRNGAFAARDFGSFERRIGRS